jgi:hypothetical protein
VGRGVQKAERALGARRERRTRKRQQHLTFLIFNQTKVQELLVEAGAD